MPNRDPDTHLMLTFQQGDPSSFTQLLTKYRQPVVHFFYRMIQDPAVAEELAQEVFLRIFHARARYVPKARFTTWLFRIATNLALNYLRDTRMEQCRERTTDVDTGELPWDLPDTSPTPEERLLREARVQEVRAAIASLPPTQRAAVIMHKYHDMEYREIAMVLGCSESAVKSLLYRAYENLRTRLVHLVRPGNAAGSLRR